MYVRELGVESMLFEPSTDSPKFVVSGRGVGRSRTWPATDPSALAFGATLNR
jgi:hypothetical protein